MRNSRAATSGCVRHSATAPRRCVPRCCRQRPRDLYGDGPQGNWGPSYGPCQSSRLRAPRPDGAVHEPLRWALPGTAGASAGAARRPCQRNGRGTGVHARPHAGGSHTYSGARGPDQCREAGARPPSGGRRRAGPRSRAGARPRIPPTAATHPCSYGGSPLASGTLGRWQQQRREVRRARRAGVDAEPRTGVLVHLRDDHRCVRNLAAAHAHADRLPCRHRVGGRLAHRGTPGPTRTP